MLHASKREHVPWHTCSAMGADENRRADKGKDDCRRYRRLHIARVGKVGVACVWQQALTEACVSGVATTTAVVQIFSRWTGVGRGLCASCVTGQHTSGGSLHAVQVCWRNRLWTRGLGQELRTRAARSWLRTLLRDDLCRRCRHRPGSRWRNCRRSSGRLQLRDKMC